GEGEGDALVEVPELSRGERSAKRPGGEEERCEKEESEDARAGHGADAGEGEASAVGRLSWRRLWPSHRPQRPHSKALLLCGPGERRKTRRPDSMGGRSIVELCSPRSEGLLKGSSVRRKSSTGAAPEDGSKTTIISAPSLRCWPDSSRAAPSARP